MAFAMIITVIGFLLLLDKMEIISGEVWSYFWPLLIIVIGLSMIYNKVVGRGHWGCWSCGGQTKFSSGKQSRKSSKK